MNETAVRAHVQTLNSCSWPGGRLSVDRTSAGSVDLRLAAEIKLDI